MKKNNLLTKYSNDTQKGLKIYKGIVIYSTQHERFIIVNSELREQVKSLFATNLLEESWISA